MHGGGSTIEKAREHWQSAKLQNEFIQVFVQSYMYYDMKTFGWGIADARARNELKECYEEIKNKYSVDVQRVIIGGISAGGYTAMDIALNTIFPTRGFIAVCPATEAQDFENEKIKQAKASGLRGVIISGENDFSLQGQKEVVDMFKETELPHHFIIIPGMGHEYPTDFEVRIDQAIEYLL